MPHGWDGLGWDSNGLMAYILPFLVHVGQDVAVPWIVNSEASSVG